MTLTTELNLNNYEIYRRDRCGKSGGGILLAINKGFKSKLILNSKSNGSIFVQVNIPNKNHYFMLLL